MSKQLGNYDFPDNPINKGVLNIKKGKIKRAQRVVIYGPEGVGKSTLASQFPKPLFIDVEGSTSELDVDRIEPATYDEVLATLNGLLDDTQGYKTIIIDTVDWLEQKMVEKICLDNKMDSIEDFGYHKGYTYLAEEMFRFVNNLNAFIDMGINVVLVGHSVVKKHELPDQRGQYDRYSLDLVKEVAPVVKEWATMLLFINWRIKMVNDLDDKKGTKAKKKAIGDNEGFIYTTHSATHDAKNRHDLAPELPLEYESIAHLFTGMPVAEVPVELEEAPEEESLLDRIKKGEAYLAEQKVKGFLNDKQLRATRNKIGQAELITGMTDSQMLRYLDHINETVNQIEGVTV